MTSGTKTVSEGFFKLHYIIVSIRNAYVDRLQFGFLEKSYHLHFITILFFSEGKYFFLKVYRFYVLFKNTSLLIFYEYWAFKVLTYGYCEPGN